MITLYSCLADGTCLLNTEITSTAIKKGLSGGVECGRGLVRGHGEISPLTCFKSGFVSNKDEQPSLNPFTALIVVSGLSHARSHWVKMV